MNQELREGNEAATNPDPSLAQQEAARDINESAADKRSSAGRAEDTALAALFAPEIAKDFRCQWDAVQSSFVDDPRGAVRQGDELVARVMKSLTETFSSERAKLEGQFDQSDKASTEDLRLALRRYRSFFERLLSL